MFDEGIDGVDWGNLRSHLGGGPVAVDSLSLSLLHKSGGGAVGRWW